LCEVTDLSGGASVGDQRGNHLANLLVSPGVFRCYGPSLEQCGDGLIDGIELQVSAGYVDVEV
jgi:hypothetical protein